MLKLQNKFLLKLFQTAKTSKKFARFAKTFKNRAKTLRDLLKLLKTALKLYDKILKLKLQKQFLLKLLKFSEIC